MPLDTLICGTCQETFTDLTLFVNHKQTPCAPEAQSQSLPVDVTSTLDGGPKQSAADNNHANSQEATELIQLHLNESGEITGMTAQGLDDDETKGHDRSTLAFLNGMDIETDLAGESLDNKDAGKATHLIILNNPGEGDVEGSNMTLLNNINLSGVGNTSQFVSLGHTSAASSVTPATEQMQVVQSSNQQNGVKENQGNEPAPVKKRRGRAKAGENKNRPLEAVPPTTAKPRVPETGPDGKLVCPQCKRSFAKERHFNTHKCLATSSYIDITKKDMKIDSGDEEAGGEVYLDSVEEEHDDDDKDFKAENEEDETEREEDEGVLDAEEGGRKKKRGRKRKRGSYEFDVDLHKNNDGARQMKEAAESLENLPIFTTDEDKAEFEKCVDVDLSQVDHMFRVHVVEQELNEMSGMVYNTPTSSSLSFYSCTVCEKVFKSVSHIRLHCITHTEIRPFRCSKCSYATNSKGNLYTHMRKHTGQFYRCTECDFKSVNKSHLVEHQMIHKNRRSQCLICQKDYSTLKSLINHIRKYHTDKKGKEYLQTFLQGRGSKNPTVLYQCHVCHRKFKKRIDRDRHLFIHDIKDLPYVQQCELCDYWASRKVYLEKHYLKHRVIYCCCLCDKKFLSTIRLNQHLTTEHAEQGGSELLSECINKSLYLPEPLSNGQGGNYYVNLPQELQEITETSQADAPQQTTSDTQLGQESGGLDSLQPPSDVLVVQASYSAENCEEPNRQTAEDGTIVVKEESEASGATNLEQGSADPNAGPEQTANMIHSENEVAGQSSDDGMNLGLQNGGKENEQEVLLLHNPGSDSDDDHDADDSTDKINEVEDGSLEGAEQGGVNESLDASPNDGDIVAEDGAAGTSDYTEDKTPAENTEGEQESASSKDGSSSQGVKVTAEDSKEKKIADLIKRLEYRKMNTDIFRKMRDTFGEEECEYCGRLFFTRAEYEPHQRTHTGDKPFACTNCSFRGHTKEQLRRHCEREHEKVAFQCKECDFLAPTRTRLWNHQLKHLGINGLTCPQCPTKFDGMKQLRAHILNCHKDIDKDLLEKLTGYRQKTTGKMGRMSFKCPHCPRVFLRANTELQKHIWIHEGIKPYTCPICPYACRSKNNLQAHMLRHSTEKPFSCSECGKEYKSKTALRWHVRSHKTGKLFKCDKCPYEATQSSHLKRHMETHEVLKRFICKHCDFSANTLGYMKIHYGKHHKGEAFAHEEIIDPASAMVDKRVYKCISCGYLFGNLSDLKRHLKIRHHVHMQDIAGMDQMQVSEVEVMQYEEPRQVVPQQIELAPGTSVLQPQTAGGEVQYQMQGAEGSQGQLSAVNLIQQIMGLSQNADGQTVQVVSEDGQPLEIGPDTIILRQDGQLLLPAAQDGGSILPGNQYIIQYINTDDVNKQTANDMSVVGEVPQVSAGLTANQQQQQLMLVGDQSRQQASAITDMYGPVHQHDNNNTANIVNVESMPAVQGPLSVLTDQNLSSAIAGSQQHQQHQVVSAVGDQTQFVVSQDDTPRLQSLSRMLGVSYQEIQNLTTLASEGQGQLVISENQGEILQPIVDAASGHEHISTSEHQQQQPQQVMQEIEDQSELVISENETIQVITSDGS